jgi:hypothetical protein
MQPSRENKARGRENKAYFGGDVDAARHQAVDDGRTVVDVHTCAHERSGARVAHTAVALTAVNTRERERERRPKKEPRQKQTKGGKNK